jgi:hypothetical protein
VQPGEGLRGSLDSRPVRHVGVCHNMTPLPRISSPGTRSPPPTRGTITAVRLQAGRAAGDPDAVAAVSAAIRDLLTQVRRYQERTTDVLLDAYQRDLGGD